MTAGSVTTTARAEPRRAEVIALGVGRWRVLGEQGSVAGLVQEHPTPEGPRYRARRFRWSTRAFLDVGDFWRLDDAVSTLRAG